MSESLIVDEGFARQHTPLTAIERAMLEESICKEGCRDAIKVWRQPESTCEECDPDEEGFVRFEKTVKA